MFGHRSGEHFPVLLKINTQKLWILKNGWISEHLILKYGLRLKKTHLIWSFYTIITSSGINNTNNAMSCAYFNEILNKMRSKIKAYKQSQLEHEFLNTRGWPSSLHGQGYLQSREYLLINLFIYFSYCSYFPISLTCWIFNVICEP